MVDKYIVNYIKNKESTAPLKYMYSGAIPTTKDILNNLKLIWYGYTDECNKIISVNNLFGDRNDKFDISGLKYFRINMAIPLLNDIKLNIPVGDILNMNDSYSYLDVSAKVYEYAIKYIKDNYPKSSIFFESLSQMRVGEYYEF